ncbi:MAG: glucose-1-phosphate adenylyltransferase subunit GlgD [Firmicutes bacterium]|nr:glucose-1-phosphate adenylyltransferase subunit GlgD [Bacillota bacterium]
MKSTMGLLFAYQNDEQMKALTQKRALSSIPFGGRYRIVDFALSNLVNSGITKVGIITRDSYQSLMDHLGSGKEWDLSRKNGGMYLLPPFSQGGFGFTGSGVYRGKMEALLNAANFIRKSDADNVILTSADCIFNMDFRDVVEFHEDKEADITVIYHKAELESKDNGETGTIYTVGDDGRILDVAINPSPALVKGDVNLGISQIVIGRGLLETLIAECASHNMYSLHRDVLQRRVNDLKIYGYEYDGYCAKIDSVASYFDANMDLLNEDIRKALFYQDRQIFTKIRDESPAIYREGSNVKNSLVADGCIIEGTVENSVIFRGVRVRKGAVIRNSIVMQDCEIQSGSQLEYSIIDKDVVIRENRKLFGYKMYPMVLAKGSVV